MSLRVDKARVTASKREKVDLDLGATHNIINIIKRSSHQDGKSSRLQLQALN